MSGQRAYKKLPVWIVENHNEVLDHIYRAIASKHLPFEGISMLHFDSHPDLQIATDMDANIVYDKHELLSLLSIENWIMPAIYAGHLRRVTWVKPPWADQLPEGSRKVMVGRHKHSGKMRINWPDSYFVSDLLYAPQEELENGKEVQIDVVTMETTFLKASDFSSTSVPCILKDDVVEKMAGLEETKESTDPDVKEHTFHKASAQNITSPDNKHCPGCREHQSSMNKAPKLDPGSCSNTTDQQTQQGHSALETDLSKVADGNRILETKNADCRGRSPTSSIPSVETTERRALDGPAVTLDDIMREFSESNDRFILDIDLDFFSTKNPFKELYSKEQYQQLKELYDFAAPVDNSAAALEGCQGRRAEQISELANCLRVAFAGQESECGIESCDVERYAKIVGLVESLKSTPGIEAECLDPEMVHMAGLTCDDHGELPHHVSTEEEMASLVSAMRGMLTKMPSPTVVTISRSSHDDYCPPDQVDGIQQKVLQMLQSLYDRLDIHLDYEVP